MALREIEFNRIMAVALNEGMNRIEFGILQKSELESFRKIFNFVNCKQPLPKDGFHRVKIFITS